MRCLSLAIALLCCVAAYGQSAVADGWKSRVMVSGSMWASAASHDSLRPLLSYSNEWGRFTQYDKYEAAAAFSVDFEHRFHNDNIRLSVGFGAQYSLDDERTMINKLHVDTRLWMCDIRCGLYNFSPIATNNALSFGSYILSNNAAPIPKVWAGILDYWSIPMPKFFTQSALNRYADLEHLLQIRGGVSFGRVDNESRADYTDNVILHESFAYARVGVWGVKPYAGLNHSVMMGGVMSDGKSIPLDFWASIFGRRGSKEKFVSVGFRGESSNAAGAHQGLWDFGFDFDLRPLAGKIYYQRPLTDGRSLNPAKLGIKDCSFGLHMQSDIVPWINALVLEFMNTRWQGGEGVADVAVHTQQGYDRYFYPYDVTDADVPNLRNDVLLPDEVEAWEKRHGRSIADCDDFHSFCVETYNRGLDTGGRLLYLTNWFYPQGWTRGGLSTGTPLMHTRATVRRYVPQGTMELTSLFPNMRVRAFNIGVAGQASCRLSYNIRLTLSHNYGEYREKYIAVPPLYDPSVSWVEKENYFFAKTKREYYSRLNLNYCFLNGWSVNSHLSFDWGDLYTSFAFRLGIAWQLDTRFI